MAPRIFFFRFNILIFIYFFKFKTIETHARAFLPLNISAVGSVISNTFIYMWQIYFYSYLNGAFLMKLSLINV